MAFPHELLAECTGFDWDEGNAAKNWERHQVSRGECEEPFFNAPFLVASDLAHSQAELRLLALGRTNAGRVLFIVFTVRETLVRVISTRDANRKERHAYERAQKNLQSGP